jgi:hypothetical protein
MRRKIVEQRLDMRAGFAPSYLVGFGNVDRRRPAKLLARNLIAVLLGLIPVHLVIAQHRGER